MSNKVRRLFAGFAPKHYRINLVPDKEAGTLSGAVTITGKKTGRPSQRITLHQKDLTIAAAHIVKHDKKGDHIIEVKRINHHAAYDEVRLHAAEMLYPGEYTITLEYSGQITRNMEGVYPCFFKQDGVEKKLIATQFESHHARSAFPCIDEPEAKATFDLTLTTPLGETVLSNTPIKEQFEKQGSLFTLFETTPVMSTYLLAFVFGELAYREATTKRGVKVRTYATHENVRHTEFALKTAVDCLDFYEDYFDINYPLTKCDFIALPDFASGAMENWGCVTFREQAMLVDPQATSLPMKQRVAEVVCHELTHQWFGNLVTMRWWTDLWLNEGFATWMAYFAMDKLFPEWKVWTTFIAEEQHYALKLDALENTHPVEVEINHPDEIRTIFDAISYEKGGSSIHMLHSFLGDTAFRDGLRHYLKRHSYSNTDTVDLWNALEEVSQKPVKKFMSTWISQAGFPLVRAHVSDATIHLSQEQFSMRQQTADDQVQAQALWPIPLTSNNASLPDLLQTEELTVPTQETPKAPLLLNRSHGGFYRVVYNASHLADLAQEVTEGKLSEEDRGGLLADIFEAAKAGYTDTSDALKLLESYHNEDSESVWGIIAGQLSSMRTVMDDDTVRELLKPYTRKLVGAQLGRLGWETEPGESHFDTLLRPKILGMAASADDPKVIAEIKRRFEYSALSDMGAPDIRGLIYTASARHGNEQTFTKLLDLHHHSTSSEERIKLCAALTNFKQPKFIQKALNLIQNTDEIRLQDTMYWLAYSFSNRFARHHTWNWMTENWQWLAKNLGNDLSFYRMPIYAARSISDAAFLPQYRTFFDSVAKPGLDRSIKQGVEMIEWQSAWKSRDLKKVQAFLASR